MGPGPHPVHPGAWHQHKAGAAGPHQRLLGWLDTGTHTWFWDSTTKTTKERLWPAVGNCSSAMRWISRYYCFRGNQFLRFDPVTGHVDPKYPRDVRDYFMSCPDRGERAPAGVGSVGLPGVAALLPQSAFTPWNDAWAPPQPHLHPRSSQVSSMGKACPLESRPSLPPRTPR